MTDCPGCLLALDLLPDAPQLFDVCGGGAGGQVGGEPVGRSGGGLATVG